MGAAKKLIDKKVLRAFVPINALSATHIEEISNKAVIEDVRSGSYVFKQGDRDYQTVYVLDGKVEFVDDKRNVVDAVTAGSEQARHPLAHKQPRQLGARAAGKVTVARIDSSLLDVLLTWDESSGYDVQEIGAQDDDDWMTRMLQSQAFMQLPPSNIHQLLMRLEAVSASAGEVIVRQGEEGDYFYIVKAGRLAVTRKTSARSKEVLLAELGEGACFGEEALVSGTKRNASVMMVTNGSLMRLSQTDFSELLCASLVHETDYESAQKLAEKGAQWLDVRLPGEFDNQSIKGSINVPLSALRDQCQELDADTDYIMCCDTGRRSAAGAFVLSQLGLSVYTLKNGLMDVPDGALTATPRPAEAPPPPQDAEIIPFDSERNASRARTGNESADRQLIDKIAVLEADKQALEAQLQEIISEYGLQEQGQQARQTELEQFKQDKETLSARLADLEQQSVASGKGSQDLQDELSRVREDYTQLEQRTSQIVDERDAAVNSLDEASGQLEQAQEQLVEVTNQLDVGQSSSSDLQQQLQQLSADSTARESELAVQVSSLEVSLDEARQTAGGEQEVLRRSLEVLQSELEGVRKSQDQQAQEREQLEQQLNDLKQQTGSASQEADQQAEQVRSKVEAEKADLLQRLENLQQVADSRQQQAEEWQANHSALETRLAELQQDLEGKNEQLQQSDKTAQQLEQEVAYKDEWKTKCTELEERATALESELGTERSRYAEAEQRIALLDDQLAGHDKQHQADIGSTREAMARAQTETDNLKREQMRLMEKMRKLELNFERERHDHEAETHRLHKELKDAAGESSAGLEAELDALQEKIKVDARARDDLEILLGERGAQVDSLKADSDTLSLQLKQAQEGAHQAEEQLLEANRMANEKMAVRIETEEKAQMALRDELAAVIAERNKSQEQFTVQQQELEELRAGLDSANQVLTGNENSTSTFEAEISKLSTERDTALEKYQQVQQELDQLRAEAEVTRGLVDMQVPVGEIDATLREELEQAKKNVDVAVRLRGQAEGHVVELETELEQLRGQYSGIEKPELPSGHIPSLDDTDPGAATVLSDEYPDDGNNTDTAATVLLEEEDNVGPAVVDEIASSSSRGSNKGLIFGVLAIVLMAAVGGWWFLKQSSVDSKAIPSQTVAPVGAVIEKPVLTEPDIAPEKIVPSPRPAIKEQVVEKLRDTPSFDKGGSALAREESVSGDIKPDATRQEPAATRKEVARPASEPKKQPIVRTYSQPLSGGGSGPAVIEFQADRFEMGSSSASANFDERPRHNVEIALFAISKHEITFADYDRFVRATGRRRPGDNGWGRGSRPVINVSWQDAVAYAEWLSVQTGSHYRLPTEAEWEFAARAGSQTRFWWGNDVGKGNANCFDCSSEWSGVLTAPVGSFNANAYAVMDMPGNAMEWVQDCYQKSYATAPSDGSAVSIADCDRRVVRGGGFDSPSDSVRSASRNSLPAASRLNNLGFRVVKARH